MPPPGECPNCRASAASGPSLPLPPDWHSLAHAFVSQVRAKWSAEAICDGTGAKLTYGETFLRALVLGRFLGRTVGPAEYVGVLLPPTVPAAVVNLALVLQGKIPVNLNYTAGQNMIDSAIDQCGITHVITSPKVLEKFQVTPRATLIPLEDVKGQLRWTDKLAGAALSRLALLRPLESLLPGLARPNLDAIATVIFTSGSTGDPKGVVLSHRNVLNNVQQVEQQVHLLPDEVLLGILPFFHSFGFTVTIWTALALGKKVVYHFNPLDSRTIGKLCEEHKVTLIAGTPSFTRFYLKNCPASQFKTLTHLILGAEKLKPELYRDINNWLDIEPMEGYGTTELSPVVAVNVPGEVDPCGRPEDPRQPARDRRAPCPRDADQDHRSRHRRGPARRGGGGHLRQGPAGDGRLPQPARGHRQGAQGRLVRHGRPGLRRRRRLPQDHRPA